MSVRKDRKIALSISVSSNLLLIASSWRHIHRLDVCLASQLRSKAQMRRKPQTLITKSQESISQDGVSTSFLLRKHFLPFLTYRGCSSAYSLCLILFLTSLEVSIVATSLVSMADDLKSFNNYSWVITAYILTYTSEKLSSSCIQPAWNNLTNYYQHF